MPRTMRVQYQGATYHVMNRGDRQENIFVDDVDRQDFLKTLAEGCQKTGWRVHAYCLMKNHFHLVVETPNANLVDGMRWFLSAYTIRLNHRQKLFGHVFSGRYKAQLVEGSGNGYLRTACVKVLRCGWCLGSEQFQEQMHQSMEGKLGEYHSGELRRESAEAKAERYPVPGKSARAAATRSRASRSHRLAAISHGQRRTVPSPGRAAGVLLGAPVSGAAIEDPNVLTVCVRLDRADHAELSAVKLVPAEVDLVRIVRDLRGQDDS